MGSWRGGIKRDKYDELFSYLVRERVNWICERCRRSYQNDRAALHCSHLYGRRIQAIRLHPWNAFAHCFGCHEYLGQHPVEFAEWAREQLGQQRYDALRVMANKPTKLPPNFKQLVHRHYLNEKRRMQRLRADGVVGRIEFDMLPGALTEFGC